MSDYTQVTDFSDKDALPSGNAAKKVKGVDFDGEFSAISVAIASKADTTGTENLTAADITATGNLAAVGITATGNLAAVGITATGNVDVADGARLRFGQDSDLQIWHNGATSNIEDTGTGDLVISGSTNLTLRRASSGPTSDKYIDCIAEGAVELYYDGVKKLETTATGTTVTGNVTATGVTTTDTLVVAKDANGILTEFKIVGGGIACGAVRAEVGTNIRDITVGSGDTSLRYAIAVGGLNGNVSPAKMSDNTSHPAAIDLGRAGSNFDNIYAANGTINTSDATEKQSIEELTEAETRVAQACKGLIRKFKWNSAVEKKGVDGARYHFGVIAQELQAAFAVEGLDAGDYGLFISSTFTDDNGVEQTRLGVRYTELLAFIIGGMV
jgi:hypothetical protein